MTRRIRIYGSTIEGLRGRLKLSPGDLAAALGVHQSTVYRWEATRTPSIDDDAAALVRALLVLPDAQLEALGAEIATACKRKGSAGRLAAARLILDAVSPPAAVTDAAADASMTGAPVMAVGEPASEPETTAAPEE